MFESLSQTLYIGSKWYVNTIRLIRFSSMLDWVHKCSVHIGFNKGNIKLARNEMATLESYLVSSRPWLPCLVLIIRAWTHVISLWVPYCQSMKLVLVSVWMLLPSVNRDDHNQSVNLCVTHKLTWTILKCDFLLLCWIFPHQRTTCDANSCSHSYKICTVLRRY